MRYETGAVSIRRMTTRSVVDTGGVSRRSGSCNVQTVGREVMWKCKCRCEMNVWEYLADGEDGGRQVGERASSGDGWDPGRARLMDDVRHVRCHAMALAWALAVLAPGRAASASASGSARGGVRGVLLNTLCSGHPCTTSGDLCICHFRRPSRSALAIVWWGLPH